MPELPEVETIKLQLDKLLSGLTIVDVSIFSPKNFIGDKNDLSGRKIIEVKRRAKVILLELDNNNYLACHLKMTGQLIYQEIPTSFRPKSRNLHNNFIDSSFRPARGGARWNDRSGMTKKGRYDVSILPNKYTRVVITLSKGKLYFNDLRKFGWMKIISFNKKHLTFNKDKDNLDRIIGDKYGPEPFDKEFTGEYLKQIFSQTKKPIKLVLLDQEKIAGMGNIYANEALFRAGIFPTKKAKQLSNLEIEKLRIAIIKILTEAIRQKGTSDKDEAYRQTTGQKGNYQHFLKIYGREKERCDQCGGIIKRLKIGGRGTFFCPVCQK